MDSYSQQLKALTVLLRASQSIQEVVRKDIASYGLNMTEFGVLELLYHKGDQPIQMIGKKVLISSSSITYVVDKLEKKELVHRRACPDDRRVTFASITDAGKQLMDTIFPKHGQKVAQIFDRLSTEQLENTINLVKQIGYRANEL